MDLHKLRCFIAVVEEGNLSKAAELLNMTQPPLSILMRRLEEELNVTLFERRSKRLFLTDTGQLLYHRAKELLASSDAIYQELTEQHEGIRGTVRIGCFTSASLFILPKVISMLSITSPHIVTRVTEGHSASILHELRKQNLDIGIVRSVFEESDLQTMTLYTEPLLLALPPDHHLLQKEHIELADLKDETFLLHSRTFGQGVSDYIIQACQMSGFSPTVIYWGTETLPMLLMVKEGIGVSFVPQCFQNLKSDNLPPLVEVASHQLVTTLSLVTLKDRYQTAVTKRFLQVTAEVIQTLGQNAEHTPLLRRNL